MIPNWHISRNLKKRYLRTCAPSEGTDSRSRIGIFTCAFFDSQRCKVSSFRQRRPYADALADLSLRWAHMSEGVAAPMTYIIVFFFFFFFFFFCFFEKTERMNDE